MPRVDLPKAPGLALLLALSACTIGPDYSRPPVETPVAFKEMGPWKPAEPQDLKDRGAWWQIYGDEELNRLVPRVVASNQNLKVFEARYRAAEAAAAGARANFYPSVSAGANTNTGQTSGGSGAISRNTGRTSSSQGSLSAGWVPDIWGDVRRSVEAADATTQASAADLAAATLSAQSALVQNYLALRYAEATYKLLTGTAESYQRQLQLVQNQYAVGTASPADIAQAETQLRATQAQAIDMEATRAQLEHAIALLLGVPASTFSLAEGDLPNVPERLPVDVPSSLLERRPDIAAAERRMAAANAQIGVALAGYYPQISLSATGSLVGSSLANWWDLPTRVWSVGAALSQMLFDGGATRAQTAQARANYDGTIATYRNTVLTAFQEVETSLSNLSVLEREAVVQNLAVNSARRSEELTINQYRAGTVSYLNVLVIQAQTLSNERAALAVQNRRLQASVQLIESLGGGWAGVP